MWYIVPINHALSPPGVNILGPSDSLSAHLDAQARLLRVTFGASPLSSFYILRGFPEFSGIDGTIVTPLQGAALRNPGKQSWEDREWGHQRADMLVLFVNCS